MLPRLRLGLEIFIPICCRRSPQDAYSESESDWGDEDEGGGRAAAAARGRPPPARKQSKPKVSEGGGRLLLHVVDSHQHASRANLR